MNAYRSPARIAARDRFNASIHEAGHFVLAEWVGVSAFAIVHATGAAGSVHERAYVGRCWMARPNGERERLMIAVAGAVAEMLAAGQETDAGEVLDAMSESDRDYAGLGADAWADEAHELLDAIEAVESLLTGALSTRWRAMAREIRRNSINLEA